MLQITNIRVFQISQYNKNIFFDRYFFNKLTYINPVNNKLLKFFETVTILDEFLINFNINRYADELITLNKNLLKMASLIKKNFYLINESLTDISIYDVPGVSYRFTFTYLLTSIKHNSRINILIKTNELNPVDSLMHIFPSACWVEREIWDLFGIFFFGHNDLRRILTDYSFEGHPLRKDFPLSGYNDLFYDDKYKKVVNVPVEFAQELRVFTFNTTWKPNSVSNV